MSAVEKAARWRAFVAGFEAGVVAGIAIGAAEIRDGLVPAAVALAAHRPSRYPAQEEVQRRRRDYRTPARGPVDAAERARCLASWTPPARAAGGRWTA